MCQIPSRIYLYEYEGNMNVYGINMNRFNDANFMLNLDI